MRLIGPNRRRTPASRRFKRRRSYFSRAWTVSLAVHLAILLLLLVTLKRKGREEWLPPPSPVTMVFESGRKEGPTLPEPSPQARPSEQAPPVPEEPPLPLPPLRHPRRRRRPRLPHRRCPRRRRPSRRRLRRRRLKRRRWNVRLRRRSRRRSGRRRPGRRISRRRWISAWAGRWARRSRAANLRRAAPAGARGHVARAGEEGRAEYLTVRRYRHR